MIRESWNVLLLRLGGHQAIVTCHYMDPNMFFSPATGILGERASQGILNI